MTAATHLVDAIRHFEAYLQQLQVAPTPAERAALQQLHDELVELLRKARPGG